MPAAFKIENNKYFVYIHPTAHAACVSESVRS